MISDQVTSILSEQTDDFFEMIEIMTRQKCIVLESMPYIFSFMIASVNTVDETIREALSEFLNEDQSIMTQDWMSHVDFSKFKEGIRPEELLEMLGLLLEGYLQQQLKNGLPINLEQIMEKHRIWADLLREASYKPTEIRKGELL